MALRRAALGAAWVLAGMALASAAQEPPPAAAPTAPAAPALPARAPSLPPEEFAGCWQDVAAEGHFLLLEADRVRELHPFDGAPPILQFARALYDLDHVVRITWGRRIRSELDFDGELLRVTTGERADRYRRVAAAAQPAALEVAPLPLGSAAPLPAPRLAALQAEFAKRREIDQAVRTDAARHAEMEAVDRDNTAWLAALVQEIGWIDVERFGAEAAGAAFLIVQHSGDLPLMSAALPAIERDVRQHGLDGQNYALLFDRLQVNLGRRQRYGSQLGSDEQGRLIVIGLEARDRVDAWRKELRMPPLAQYLDFFRKGTPPKVVLFEDDLPE
ncbi:MAG: hypothetical protein JNL90_06350 [Planctomycetes bacterium]|nr:hypothetical protein [Planctomycetota bacterium]